MKTELRISVLLSLFAAGVASAQDSEVSFKSTEVAPGIFMLEGQGGFAGGSVAGYIAAQKDMLSLAGPETRIIPGHGPVANKADLQAALDMLVGARDRVQALVDDGRSEEEVLAANPLEMYHEDWNWQFITTERMTRTLYQDLTRD
jgi:glyoxylase-like metal-dependent hydrolase (beta-lactamase superfamily II)